MTKPTRKLKHCSLCHAPHPGVSCHFATTDAMPLYQAGVDKMGTAKALAKEIGTTEETLSRARRRTPLVLSTQVRFDLVQFLLGKPVHAPPKATGTSAKLAPRIMRVWVDDATHEYLSALHASESTGIAPTVRAALAWWCDRYADTPRATWPAFEATRGRHLHTVATDPAEAMRFDLAIGGPGWRRFYAPVAIRQYIAEVASVAA